MIIRVPRPSWHLRYFLPAHLRGWPAVGLALGTVVLLMAAVQQTAGALDPVSLWLDDLWVATLVKRASLTQLVALHAPSPYGFIGLLKLIRALCGDGHLQLQALPFVARLAAIAGLGLVTFEFTRNPGLGLLAAVGMAMQHDLAEQSVRVKQYSLDALVSVVLLGCGVACLRRGGRARLGAFGALCLVALPCSFPSAFVGPPLFSLCAWHVAQTEARTSAGRALGTLALAVAVDALGALLLAWMVKQKTTPLLQDFWAAYYPQTDTLAHFARFFRREAGADFLSAGFAPLRPLAWLMPVGVLRLGLARWTRPLAVFALLLFLAMLCSAALRLYPLGSERLDSFVRPLQIFLAVVALQPPRRLRASRVLVLLGWAASAGLLLVAAERLHAQPVAYVPAWEKPLAARVQRWLVAGDTALLLFPFANWAFAYYTDEPVHLIAVDDSTNGFFAIPERPQSLVLRETWQGAFFSAYARDRAAFGAQLQPLLASSPRRIAFYGSYGDAADYRVMLRQLGRFGYTVLEQSSRHRAIAALLERR